MRKKAKSDKGPLYIDPEPGDEKLTPMELEWKYHVPFEGTVFPIRPSPDPEKLRKMREKNAMGTDMRPSIFRGVDEAVNTLLGLVGQRARGKDLTFADVLGAKQLKKSPRDGFGNTLINDIYKKIHSNCFDDPKNRRRPSKKLWVLRTMTKLSPRYSEKEAKEVPLERRAVEIFELCKIFAVGRPTVVSWYNQIPTASGLVSSASERRNAVDLVCRRQKGIYDLIELKSNANNPLYAAIEILKHGVLYLFFVSNLKDMNFRPQSTGLSPGVDARELIEAREITLCVLAPKEYYDGYSLRWLEDELNEGLQSLLKDRSPRFLRKLEFRFEWYRHPPFAPAEDGGFIFDFTRNRCDWNSSTIGGLKG